MRPILTASVCILLLASGDMTVACDFLPGVDCSRSYITEDASGADLRNWTAETAYFNGARFNGADLEDANLRGSYLLGVEARSADLTRANLSGSYMNGADFDGANLRGADLSYTRLTQVSTRDADLSGANLYNAILESAHMTRADLRGANLTYATLNGLDLDGADFRGANLEYAATARGLSLKGADLRDVDARPLVAEAMFWTGALYNRNTRLPDHWSPANHEMEYVPEPGTIHVDPLTGHLYELAGKMTWANAQEFANGSSLGSVRGHLVTITSPDEQAFVASTFSAPNRSFWLGANDESFNEEWKWAVGPDAGQVFWRGASDGAPTGFENWGDRQPPVHDDSKSNLVGWRAGSWETFNEGTTLSTLIEYSVLSGDANDDGKVDTRDFAILKRNFGKPASFSRGDFDVDGVVGLSDYGLLKQAFGRSSSVPEPPTIALLTIAMVVLAVARPAMQLRP